MLIAGHRFFNPWIPVLCDMNEKYRQQLSSIGLRMEAQRMKTPIKIRDD